MNLSKHIKKIDLNSAKDKFAISTNEEQIDEAEAVIVTVPVPQVLTQLKGSINQLIGTYQIRLHILVYLHSVLFSKMIIKK
jgi:protoporphyrinogen oxidase